MVARHARYVSKSVEILLAGGALVQDFELQPIGTAGSRESTSIVSAEPTRFPTSAPSIASLWARHVVDSSDFEEAAGPYGLPAALAGRLAGVVVTSSSTFGGSSSIVMRGSRSVIGTNQPSSSVARRSTLDAHHRRSSLPGGLTTRPPRGSNLGDIATVEATGPAATALYGGRAANGALKLPRGRAALNAFHVSPASKSRSSRRVCVPSNITPGPWRKILIL
jgi:hypothetical protein